METDNQKNINELKKRITQLEFLVELQKTEIDNLKRERESMRKQMAFNAIDEWFNQE